MKTGIDHGLLFLGRKIIKLRVHTAPLLTAAVNTNITPLTVSEKALRKSTGAKTCYLFHERVKI